MHAAPEAVAASVPTQEPLADGAAAIEPTAAFKPASAGEPTEPSAAQALAEQRLSVLLLLQQQH